MLKNIIGNFKNIFNNKLKNELTKINKMFIEIYDLKDFSDISVYDIDYIDSIKKYVCYSIIEFNDNIFFDKDKYYTYENEVIYVLLQKIDDKRIEITYMSNYPLKFLIKNLCFSNFKKSKKIIDFDNMVENKEKDYFYSLNETIFYNNYIYSSMPMKKVSNIENFKYLYMIENNKIYNITEYRIYEDDYYLNCSWNNCNLILV